MDGLELSRRVLFSLAGVLAVVALLAAGVGLLRDDVEAAWTSLPKVQSVLTTCPGSDIGVVDDEEARLLTGDGHSFNPSISPDGRWIAFERGDPDTIGPQGWDRHQLWVMATDGSSARALTEMGEQTYKPLVWSSDSHVVMYHTDDALVGVNVTSGVSSEIVSDVEPELWAGWDDVSFAPSPDDSKLVVGGVPSIFNLADGSQAAIANGEFSRADGVLWSPNGQWLVMTAKSRVTKDPEGGLWAYNVSDGSSWQISENTSVEYEWTGPDTLLNIRYGEGDSQTAYMSDLSEQSSISVAVPEPAPHFAEALSECAR